MNLKVLQDTVNSCTKCDLHKTKTNYVFARGNPEAKILVCAEAPGEKEDLAALPLVGPSGKLLDDNLKALGFDSNLDAYICNIIKCRPPGNRKPEEEEINSCIEYVEQQIQLVNPKVIVALGNIATQSLINTTLGITKARGKIFKYKGKIPLIPTYHPSYVLRNGRGQYELTFRDDLKLAVDKANEST